MQISGNWSLVSPRSFETNVDFFEVDLDLAFNPLSKLVEPVFGIRYASGYRTVCIFTEDNNLQRGFAYIDANCGSSLVGRSSGRTRTVGSSHCEIHANEYRLDDEASQASDAVRTQTQ